MYSQRIAMFADAIVVRPDASQREQARRDLETSIRIFTQAHKALTTGDPRLNPAGWPPSSVRAMYFGQPFQVDAQVREYVAHARAVQLRAPTGVRSGDPDLEYLLSVGPGPLLQSLDAVVAQYNREQTASIQKFEYLQLGLLVLGLSTLVIIWLTIFLPMDREIAR